jgi:hypothetical protein
VLLALDELGGAPGRMDRFPDAAHAAALHPLVDETHPDRHDPSRVGADRRHVREPHPVGILRHLRAEEIELLRAEEGEDLLVAVQSLQHEGDGAGKELLARGVHEGLVGEATTGVVQIRQAVLPRRLDFLHHRPVSPA